MSKRRAVSAFVLLTLLISLCSNGVYAHTAYFIGDFVWHDLNGNGLQDNGEPGIDGVTVTVNNLDWNIQETNTTQNGGKYELSTFLGEIEVTFSNIPDGFEPTITGQNPSAANDSNGLTFKYDFYDYADNFTFDLGLVKKTYKLGDYVWFDTNRNGIQDTAEKGVAGITVTLYSGDSQIGQPTTTDANGHYYFTDLDEGEYKVVFSNIPAKYEITQANAEIGQINDDDKDSDGQVENGEVVAHTIINGNNNLTLALGLVNVKRYVKVTKNWVGPEQGSAIVNLLADDTKVDDVTLTEAVSWTHNFWVDKYDDESNEISYTITEDDINDYSAAITGDMTNGFVITNTNTEKVAVSVEKQWVGKAGDVATINLLADGTKVDTVVLDESNNWQHVFTALPMYTDGGDGITYAVTEDDIADYSAEIAGDMATGFVITNTNTEKVAVSVEKRWSGKKEAAATIKLLADGVKTDSVVLNQGNDWKHRFTDLPKYKDDKAIVYAVEEEAIPGYASEITATTGSALSFTVTNRNIETVEIHAKKVWVGGEEDSATLNIFADGVLKRSVKLVTDAWQKFVGLFAKYDDDGNEIDYTVEEEAIAGYTTSYSKTTGTAQNSTGAAITFEVTNTKVAMPTPKTYQLGDYVWLDGNADGIQDAAESGMAGVVVTLKKPDGATITTVTDSDGKYLFENLSNGNYKVKFTVPEGYVETLPNVGNDALDSDGVDVLVTIDGADNMTIDLGLTHDGIGGGTDVAYKIGDYVWHDENANGIQDVGEPGVAGVVVTLKDDKGSALKTTTTDTAGKYSFTGLENGNYTVVFDKTTLPAGYEETVHNQGGDDRDSDGLVVDVTINDADDLTIDLGIVKNSNKPVETTTQPEQTTTEPEQTTTAPEQTTTAPEQTTTEPEQTTTAPKQTTTEPEQTTTAPEQTTTVPKQTTTAPKQTTTAPKQTTTQPRQTTTQPKQTRERTVTPTKPSQTPTKPVEPTTAPLETATQSSEVTQETTTTEAVTESRLPRYSYDRVPSPKDPNSPDEIFIIAADGTPLGSYKKETLPNGEIVYISEDGVPLGTTPIVQTGNDFPQYLLIVIALLALVGMFIVRRAYRKQYNN